MERLDYENTTGIWQVVSYQMITSKKASEVLDVCQGQSPDNSQYTGNRLPEQRGICLYVFAPAMVLRPGAKEVTFAKPPPGSRAWGKSAKALAKGAGVGMVVRPKGKVMELENDIDIYIRQM